LEGKKRPFEEKKDGKRKGNRYEGKGSIGGQGDFLVRWDWGHRGEKKVKNPPLGEKVQGQEGPGGQ